MPDCQATENAVVEIWHCDAEGNYSGYPEDIGRSLRKSLLFLNNNSENIGYNVKPKNEKRFLRGKQKSDANDILEFNTILPSWYKGRAPHIPLRL